MPLYDYAMQANKSGLCVLPPKEDGSKAPLEDWKKYQQEPSTGKDIKRWYGDCAGIGYVTGAVSGNLEVMDFDVKDYYFEWLDAMDSYGLKELADRLVNGYMETTPKGVHLFYRCKSIAGNKKLASSADRKQVYIETRGEGGYIVAAPSNGKVNPAGKYELKSGSVASIPTITPEERRHLHNVASILDESAPKPKRIVNEPKQATTEGERRPGDEFNDVATWDDILQKHGWELMFHHHGVDFWRKPGSKSHTHHATTNYQGSDLLYVFSTSAPPFESETSYSKFAAYAYLEHGGDFAAAASELGNQGFGDPPPPPKAEELPAWAKESEPAPKKERRRTSFTAKELQTETFPPTRKLCDIMPEGLLILGGNPKIGKSWFCLELLISADTGRPLFGKYPLTISTPVIYLALEDNERRMSDRIKKLTRPVLQFDRHVDLSGNSVIELSWPNIAHGGLAQLDELIDEKKSKLVIIDTLAKIKPKAGKTGTAYDDDYACIVPLQQLASSKGITVMLITHLTKSKIGTDPFELLQGSMGVSGAADAIYVLKRSTDNNAELYVRGRDIEEQTILLEMHEGQWVYAGEADDCPTVCKYQKLILECLHENGKNMTPIEINRWLKGNEGVEDPAIRRTMLKLFDEGIVKKAGHGRYYI